MALNSNFRTLTADNIEGLVDNRNYLKSSFENATTQGWTEMAVTLTSGLPTGTPTISSTAASSITLSTTSPTPPPGGSVIPPLSGSRSLLVTGAAGWTAGQGFISDEFTLDRMDLGKPLTVTFDYERVTGTLNFSGTLGSQTLMVYIYDATAGGANWIQPAGFLGMNQSSGPGRVTATFQSSVVAGQKYRVAVIASQAVGSACLIEFDNFTCSRVTAPIGPVVTDWVSYTPTGLWTSGVTYSGKWRRVGDSIEIEARVVVNTTPTATNLVINIPSQFTIDSSKLSSPDFLTTVFGVGHAFDVSTSAHYNLQAGLSGNGVFLTYQNQLTGQVIGITNTVPFTFAAGDSVDVTFKVPVTGWSSSLQLSSDTDTRVVAARYTTASGSTGGRIQFNTLDFDTHAATTTGASWAYVAPVSGIYEVSCYVQTSGNIGQNGLTIISSSNPGQTIGAFGSSGVSATVVQGTGTIRLSAGDNFYISLGGTPVSILTGWVTVKRLSGPSVIAASETVALVRKSSSGQTINNGIGAYVDLPIADIDTHNGWVAASGSYNAATGTWSVQNPGYRVPVSGKYLVSGTVGYLQDVFNGSIASTNLLKNGSSFATGVSSSSASSAQYITSATAMVNCVAGDLISLNTFQSTGGTRTLQTYGSERTYLSIVRVGQ